MLRFSPLGLFFLLVMPVQAQSSASHFFDQSTRRETTFQLQNATTSDFLIAWAKAGNFNVIADAAQFDDKAETVSGERKGLLGQLLLTFAAEHKLHGRRYDENTFLLWKAVPDAVPTARLIIAREQAVMAAAPPPLKQEAMNALLKDYFQRVHGWDGQSTEINVTVKVADLPPELRERVMVAVRDELLAKVRRDYVWFSDDLWSKARLHLRSGHQLHHNAVMVVGAAVMGDFYGTQRLFYERRSVLKPYNSAQTTFNSAKVSRAEPRPQVVETALQQNTEPKLVADKTIQQTSQLSRMQLQGDPALQTPISLQSKQLSLGDFLSELQKQSGLAFAVSPETAPTVRFTVRLEKMPLGKVLDALSQLYGFSWEKTNAGDYALQNGALDELDKRLLRINRPETFPVMSTPEQSQEARQYVTDYLDDLFDRIDVDEASRDAGIPFEELDAEVQEKIRTRCERMIASQLVRNYQAAQEKLSEDLELNFRAFAPNVPEFARDQAPQTLDLIHLMLTVHLPVKSPYAQIVLAQVQPDLQKRQFSGTLIARIFPTFPSGQNSDPRSPDGAKRAFERMQQRMKANRAARQNGQTQPTR